MSNVINDLDDKGAWPTEVQTYLNENSDIFYNWNKRPLPYENYHLTFDKALDGLKEMLQPYYLQGYHCSRLTENEITTILSKGMFLPNGNTLKKRIENLINEGILERKIAEQLISSNKADDENRKNMLWFCFFQPHIEGQSGIEDFFRFWGGEALYRLHQNNSVVSEILSNIGIPCVIEATVPISELKGNKIASKIVDTYMTTLGFEAQTRHIDGQLIKDLSPNYIIDIIKHPTEKFMQLTKCHTWTRDLI